MDFVNFQAGEIFEEINNEGMGPEKALNFIRAKSDLYDKKEWLALHNNLLHRYELSHDEHLKVCKASGDPMECTTSKWHFQVLNFLKRDIKSLEEDIATSIPENSDFSEEDRKNANSRIDEILSELEKLKMGQEIIYSDVLDELNQMREMFFLDKKTWRQLLTGKLVEMVASGVVSETISKRIADTINPMAANLLG